jgi:tetratricopeptide (TPR) repeat protein
MVDPNIHNGKAPSLSLSSQDGFESHCPNQRDLELGGLGVIVETGEVLIRRLYELGNWYGDQGDHQKAISKLQRATRLCEASGSECSVLFGLIHNGLGHSLYRLGRRLDSELSYRIAFQTFSSLRGGNLNLDQDVAVGFIHHCLGRELHEMGLLVEAEISFELALNDLESRFGNSHNTVASVLNDYAITKSEQSFHLNAVQLLTRAFEIHSANGTANVNDAADILTNLGNAFGDECRPFDAINTYQAAIKIYETNGNQDAVAGALRNMGIAYEKLGKFGVAECKYWEALERSGRLDLDTLSNIARTFVGRRLYPEAVCYFELSIEEKGGVDVQVDNGVDNDLNELGCCFASMGMLWKAFQLWDLTLTRFLERHGQFHISIIDTFNNIGVGYFIAGEYAIALEYFTEALATIDFLPCDGNTVETAADLSNNIGLVYHRQGRHLDAVQMFKLGIQMYEELYGCEHVKTADTVNNLGETLSSYGYQGEAVRELKKAERMYRDAYGHNYVGIGDVLANLGAIYKKQQNYQDAIRAFEDGYHIYKECLGTGHEGTTEALYELAVVLHESGSSRGAQVAKKVKDMWRSYAPQCLDTPRGIWIIHKAQEMETSC